jgi:hypothetical protein
VASYIFGQKYYPINYPIKDIFFYVVVSILLFVGLTFANQMLPTWAALGVNTLIILLFVAIIIKRDMPLSKLPVIGKHLKK